MSWLRTHRRKLFPGYASWWKWKSTDRSWYVVRNTPGDRFRRDHHEADSAQRRRSGGAYSATAGKHDASGGEADGASRRQIRITGGAFAEQMARVEEVFPDKGRIRVLLNVFGSDTSRSIGCRTI